MATGIAAMMLQCVFEGSLSVSEVDKERRPYHKNCSCALHKPEDETPKACFHHTRISFAKKPSWSINCSLSTTDTANPIQSSSRQCAFNDCPAKTLQPNNGKSYLEQSTHSRSSYLKQTLGTIIFKNTGKDSIYHADK
ncbi:hypothetical protein LXL04_018176 [Taraxacum kok-saghyz]